MLKPSANLFIHAAGLADGHKFSAVRRLSRRLRPVEKRNFYPPHLHFAPSSGVDPIGISQKKSLASENSVIVRRCLRDPIFSCFARTLTSDRRTDRRTNV